MSNFKIGNLRVQPSYTTNVKKTDDGSKGHGDIANIAKQVFAKLDICRGYGSQAEGEVNEITDQLKAGHDVPNLKSQMKHFDSLCDQRNVDMVGAAHLVGTITPVTPADADNPTITDISNQATQNEQAARKNLFDALQGKDSEGKDIQKDDRSKAILMAANTWIQQNQVLNTILAKINQAASDAVQTLRN